MMKFLAIILLALTTSASAMANGMPCGTMPELENAAAQRAITDAVKADLGAAVVEKPFIERARRNVTELSRTFELPRNQVVEIYLFYICKALIMKGTGPDRLSETLSRLRQALRSPHAAKEPGASEAKPVREGFAILDKPPSETNSVTATDTDQARAEARRAERTEEKGTGLPEDTREDPRTSEKSNAKPSRDERRAAKPSEPEATAAPVKPQSVDTFTSKPAPASKPDEKAPGVAKAPDSQPTISGKLTSRTSKARRSNPPDSVGHKFRAIAPSTPDAPRSNSTPNGQFDGPRSLQFALPPTQTTPAQPKAKRSRDQAKPSVREPAASLQSAPAPVETGRDAQEPSEPRAELMSREAAPEQSVSGESISDDTSDEQTQTTEEAAETKEAAAPGAEEDAGCPERGMLGPQCFDADAAIERLRERPVEYNHPKQMIKGQATEITLVLRTDFKGEELPEEVSEAFESLQGEVKQQRTRIASIMSAQLRGADFEIDPAGMLDRTITWRRPVKWSWYVTPQESGKAKRLELELYAHIVNPQGQTQPPVLIRTFDATIDVDVRTLDWLVEQARTFEPIYAIAAAIIGLFTALLTLWLRGKPANSPNHSGSPSGISTSEAPPDRRISNMSASEAAAAAARKGEDENDGGGSTRDGRA